MGVNATWNSIQAKAGHDPDQLRVARPAPIFLTTTQSGLTQSVAYWAHNPEVAGSNPAPATKGTHLPSGEVSFMEDPSTGTRRAGLISQHVHDDTEAVTGQVPGSGLCLCVGAASPRWVRERTARPGP